MRDPGAGDWMEGEEEQGQVGNLQDADEKRRSRLIEIAIQHDIKRSGLVNWMVTSPVRCYDLNSAHAHTERRGNGGCDRARSGTLLWRPCRPRRGEGRQGEAQAPFTAILEPAARRSPTPAKACE
jgi:hypothetical protein